jgi:hypothetical protein
MKRATLLVVALVSFALVASLGAGYRAQAQSAKAPAASPYPKMAPLEQYLMERDAEVALARSAAPASISGDAEVLVLGRRGYETAVQGKNDFVCMVERSWMSGIDDDGFWNPKTRGPVCYNGAAARFMIPLDMKKTKSVLAGRSSAEMGEEIKAAFDKKELPALEAGAMCYMMSKQGYLNDRAGHWHPHLMFLVSGEVAPAWGANVDGSPVLANEDALDRYTLFLVPIGKWSDGTAAHED